MENQYKNVKALEMSKSRLEKGFELKPNMFCGNASQEGAMSIRDLVQGRQITGSGRVQPFEEVFRLHHRRVRSVFLRMTGNPAEAEDLTQDVFVQVFRKLSNFRGESAFITWLHRLTAPVKESGSRSDRRWVAR
jgi:hypothetical protein